MAKDTPQGQEVRSSSTSNRPHADGLLPCGTLEYPLVPFCTGKEGTKRVLESIKTLGKFAHSQQQEIHQLRDDFASVREVCVYIHVVPRLGC